MPEPGGGWSTGRCMRHSLLKHAYEAADVMQMVRCVFENRVHFHDGSSEIAPLHRSPTCRRPHQGPAGGARAPKIAAPGIAARLQRRPPTPLLEPQSDAETGLDHNGFRDDVLNRGRYSQCVQQLANRSSTWIAVVPANAGLSILSIAADGLGKDCALECGSAPAAWCLPTARTTMALRTACPDRVTGYHRRGWDGRD